MRSKNTLKSHLLLCEQTSFDCRTGALPGHGHSMELPLQDKKFLFQVFFLPLQGGLLSFQRVIICLQLLAPMTLSGTENKYFTCQMLQLLWMYLTGGYIGITYIKN